MPHVKGKDIRCPKLREALYGTVRPRRHRVRARSWSSSGLPRRRVLGQQEMVWSTVGMESE